MKDKLTYIALSLLAALGLLLSCTKLPEEQPGPQEPAVPADRTVHYRASAGEGTQTRATLNAYEQYIFEKGDELYIVDKTYAVALAADPGTTTTPQIYGFLSLVSGAGETTATFEGDLQLVGEFSPTAATELSAILVGKDDEIHACANGRVTGTAWPKDKFAASLPEAIHRFSHLTAVGNYGDHAFSLEQQSAFVVFSISLAEDVGDEVTATLENGEDTYSDVVEVTEEYFSDQANFVIAFKKETSLFAGANIKLIDGSTQVYSTLVGDAGTSLLGNKVYTVSRAQETPNFFTVQATVDGTTIVFNYTNQGTVYYKKGTSDWAAYSAGILLNRGEYVQFIVTGRTSLYYNIENTPIFSSGEKLCYVYGDLMSLFWNGTVDTSTNPVTVTGSAGTSLAGKNKAFQWAFKNATWIDIPASKPLKLSATTLSQECYSNMFLGCTNLKNPPKFTDAEVKSSSYASMFKDCTALETAPDLPATTVGDSGYKEMFSGCTALRTAPATLNGTSANNACERMFYGCSALISAPALPTENIGSKGYLEMFRNCTSLTVAPDLPAGTVGTQAYQSMFQGCTALYKAPDTLPAMTLTSSCYKQMFEGCSALTNTPTLPATSSAEQCYYAMFKDCISITHAPSALPLTSIGNSGCNQMFYGCSSLEEAPDLSTVSSVGTSACFQMFMNCGELTTVPSVLNPTTLPANACNQMFANCVKISSAPEIKATSVEESACYRMFYACKRLVTVPDFVVETVGTSGLREMFAGGCISLAIAPDLSTITTVGSSGCRAMFSGCSRLVLAPALTNLTTLPEDSTCNLYDMFLNCTSLTTPPATLPATTLRQECYYRMFQGCTALTAAPSSLPATVVPQSAYQQMFYNCTSLATAPAFPEGMTSVGKNGCYSMFYNCKSLTTPPVLNATTLGETCYYSMFNGSGLTSAPVLPAGVSTGALAKGCYQQMFMNCASLTTPPALNAETLAEACYYSMFQGAGLTSVPALPAASMEMECYRQMFQSCKSLTSVPAKLLQATTLAESCYRGMFDSSAITAAPELPATTLATYCYQYMFHACKSLTGPVYLPAQTLVQNCYNNMFSQASNFTAVTCLATDHSATDCTTNWLSEVKATGVFTKDKNATWALNNVSEVPPGWTLKTYQLEPIFPTDNPFNPQEDL